MPMNMTKIINMANLKCLEYPCIHICNIEDAKIIIEFALDRS